MFEYGYDVQVIDNAYCPFRNGKQCVTNLQRPISYKSRQAAENYINKQVAVHRQDDELGDEGRAKLRAEYEAKEARMVEQRKQAEQERMEYQKRQAEAKRQRYLTNAILRENGYRWQKWQNDEEDIDLLGMPEYEWILRAPDNHVVSTQEAMQELAFAGVNDAKSWLADHNIAEAIPAIEKKRQEESTKLQAIEDAPMTPEREEYIHEAIPALIEAGLTQERASFEAKRLSLPHAPQEDDVRLASVHLPHIDGILVINSDFRYGVLIAGVWNGIAEVIDRYPEMVKQLTVYAERNNRSRS